MSQLIKIQEFRKELALAETYEEIKLIGDKASAMADFARRNDVAKEKQDELGEFRIEIEAKKGAWLDEFYPHGGDVKSEKSSSKSSNLKSIGITPDESSNARLIKNEPDIVKEVVENLKKDDKKVVTPYAVQQEIRKRKNLNNRKQKEREETKKNIKTIPVIKKMPALEFLNTIDSIDLLITDPPYFTDGDFTKEVSQALAKVKSTGQAYVFAGAYPQEVNAYLNLDTHHMELCQILVWNYNNTGQRQPNVRYTSNYQICFYYRGKDAPNINKPADGKEQYACQTINAPDGRLGNRFHKWQKPNELIKRLIKNSSNEGDLIVDIFAGSGTTLINASTLGRNAIGCDIDDAAINICIERGCKHEF